MRQPAPQDDPSQDQFLFIGRDPNAWFLSAEELKRACQRFRRGVAGALSVVVGLVLIVEDQHA